MLHTDALPLSAYFADVDEDWDEPQPEIRWRFMSTDGLEDVADREDLPMIFRCYFDAGVEDFTVELEYTEPEQF